MRKKVLMTLAEKVEDTKENHFAVKYEVDEEDCFDFALSLYNLNYDVYFVNWNDLDDREFDRMFHYNTNAFVSPVSIDDMSLIFAYKMEGFLFPDNRDRFYRMIRIFDESPAVTVNDPRTIRWNIDKEHLFDLKGWGVKTIPTYQVREVRDRIANGEKFIIKPKNGERGLDQRLVQKLDDLNGLIENENKYLAQEFGPSVRSGERSLIYIGDEVSHAILKTPNPDDPNEYRCNESRGGIVKKYNPTIKELNFARDLIKKVSFHYPVNFSRIDMIDINGEPILMEAEMLNPSIFANYIGIGKRYGKNLASYFDRLIKNNKKPAYREAVTL